MVETLAILSAVTALFAVVLGPLVSLWAAQRQSRVAVLSANRQAWINTLRDLLAECMAISGFIHVADWSERKQSEFDEKMERFALVVSKIRLMLNPNEQDHQRLNEMLAELMASLRSLKEKNAVKGAKIMRDFVPLSQTILKREWERVKRVE
ncbi:MAG: hypothetical protein KF796_06875 [Ramlibacter sp.]|nr:hypothetical protein [Ramlibacter sp.]